MNDNDSVRITRITHSCVLIDVAGVMVLTDPWFSEKFGYYRGEGLGMTVSELPTLDAVIISHKHYDHNDMSTFAAYADKSVPVLLEGGAAEAVRDAGFRNVRALTPFEATSVGSISITAVPARHGVPEIGFVLQGSGFTVYFGGDTLMMPALLEIGRRYSRIDLALLPINGLRIFGKQVVMTPPEAAQLCESMAPRFAIPTHYAFTGGRLMDALVFGYAAPQDRLPDIFTDAVAQHAPQTRVEVLEPGVTFTIPHAEEPVALGRISSRAT